jgi:hypothetical protein
MNLSAIGKHARWGKSTRLGNRPNTAGHVSNNRLALLPHIPLAGDSNNTADLLPRSQAAFPQPIRRIRQQELLRFHRHVLAM